jgi:hypothetical protein
MDEVASVSDRCGVTDFAFYDDALLYRADKGLVPFLEALRERGPRPRLHCPNGLHLGYLTPELSTLMKAAGFVTLRFGFESSAPGQRSRTESKAARHVAWQAMRYAREAGFASTDLGIYVMGGLPGQTPSQMTDDLRFVADLGVLVKPVFVSPVPHTRLFEEYRSRFPDLATDPLTHNDTYFVTRLPRWGWAAVEEIRGLARELNARLQSSARHPSSGNAET